MKKLALLGALALALPGAVVGCSSDSAQKFADNVATTTQAVDTLDTAVIKLGSDVVANQEKLAAALAKTYCPIINATVSLGAAIKADAAVDRVGRESFRDRMARGGRKGV